MRKLAAAMAVLCLGALLTPPVAAQPQVLQPSVGQLEIQFNPAFVQEIDAIFGPGTVPAWLAICTATQIEPGVVVTASHCIIDDTFASDYTGTGGGMRRESLAARWSLRRLDRVLADSGIARRLDQGTGRQCDEYGCWTNEPLVVGYRIGFYGGITSHVVYAPAVVTFSGFRLTGDVTNYPRPDVAVRTAQDDPLYQADVAVLALAGTWPYSMGKPLAESLPDINGHLNRCGSGSEAAEGRASDPATFAAGCGEAIQSVGFSAGIRQWEGTSGYRGLYYLDGYGWVGVVQSFLEEWEPGASGSIMYDHEGIVGVLTLGVGAPGGLANFTGFVPVGILKLALERAGVTVP